MTPRQGFVKMRGGGETLRRVAVDIRRRSELLAALPARAAALDVAWKVGRRSEQRVAAFVQGMRGQVAWVPEPITHFLLPGRVLPGVSGVAASAVAACVGEADAALQGNFGILGFGTLAFGDPPRWHLDPTSGSEWALVRHGTLIAARDGSDVKIPWEASRMHWLTSLARAGAYTDDPKYRDGALDLLVKWSRGNPPGMGVNWSNAMEAGIRMVNLSWSAEIFGDPSIDVLVGALARRHGRFILGNLEYTPRLTSNHFMADLVGLVHAGGLLRHTIEGRVWLRIGAALLQREVLKQFHEDGMNFEASTAYHRLSTELVVLGLLALDRLEIPVAGTVRDRLGAALGVLELITAPSGRFPPIGDDDSGIAVGLASGRDHRDGAVIVEVGRRFLGLPPRMPIANEFERWVATESDQRPEPIGRTPLSQRAGLIQLRMGPWWCLADCGGVGQRGNGGHAHNDTLSFVLYANGEEVIADPGTGGYTRDPEMRNRLRSTRAHATVEVDGEEINAFVAGALFTLSDCDGPSIDAMESDGYRLFAEARHRGYERLADPVTHTRTWEIVNGAIVIADTLHCRGDHRAVVTFPLGAAVAVEPTSDGWCLRCGEERVLLCQVEGPSIELELHPAVLSPAYGSIVDSWVLRGTLTITGSTRWSYRFAIA